MKTLTYISVIVALATALSLTGQTLFDATKSIGEGDYLLASQQIKSYLSNNSGDNSALILAGDIYIELEKPDSAIIFYRVADNNSSTSITRRKIGLALSQAGKHDEAIVALRNLTQKDKRDQLNFLALGQALIAADSINSAELIIIKAREMDKTKPEAFLTLGDLYLARKVYELARSNYDDALKLNPELIETRTKLATVYYKMAQIETDDVLSQEYFKRSLTEWNTITKQEKNNAKAWFEQGKILFLSTKYADAAKSFREYVRLRPGTTGNPLAVWYLGQSFYQIKQCDSAAPYLRLAAETIDSVKSKANLFMAKCYFDAKQWRLCLESYGRISTVTDPVDLERWGTASVFAGDSTKAIDLLWKSYYIDHKRCNFLYRFALLLKATKRFSDAMTVYRKRLELCNDSLGVRIRVDIANMFMEQMRYDSAETEFSAMIALDSSSIYPRRQLAVCLFNQKKLPESKAVLLSAIEYGKRDVVRYGKDLSGCYAELCKQSLEEKNYSEVLKNAKAWNELIPTEPNALLYVAIAYHGNGDKDNACKFYKEVLKMDKTNKSASDNLKKLGC